MNKLITLVLILIPFLMNSQIEVPKSDSTIISHVAYSLVYSEQHEQSVWACYTLTFDELIQNVDRKNSFRTDPLVKSGTANNSDYYKSGYDKGHLIPLRDMQYSEITMKESSYFSNICPQEPSFNRGIWLRLENKVRKWSETFDVLYIAAGPILNHNLKTIGNNQVSIPNFYYKVIVGEIDGYYHGIAFMIPNTKSDLDIMSYVVDIDFIEAITGIDFFYKLEDDIENLIENCTSKDIWYE